MSDKTTETPAAEEQAAARDATNWAKSVSRLNVSEVSEGAVNINVDGRRCSCGHKQEDPPWRPTSTLRHLDHKRDHAVA
jgi:hypothetical protein